MNTRSITLVNYSLKWKATYNKIKKSLLHMIDDKVEVSIEHIGATAIKDAISRPFIDLAIGLVDALDLITLRDLLARKGLSYAPKVSSPQDIVMVKWNGIKIDFVVHILPIYSDVWKRMISFRNYLITHPDSVREYNELKRQLSYEQHVGPKEYDVKKLEFADKICKTLLRC